MGHPRATLRYDAASDTEYGTLRSFIEHRWDVNDGVEKFTLINSYIELGGLRAGYSDSRCPHRHRDTAIVSAVVLERRLPLSL